MSSGTQDAAMANGGLFSPMHPPSSMSPSLGPPAKSPIDGRPDSRSPVLSSYSQRSSDAISASQHDSLLLRSASRSSPVLAGSPRGPSPLGWSGLPNDPRPHHNISPSRPFMPPSAPNHVPTSMPPRSDPWRGPSGNMPPSGPPYPGPAYMPQNGMQGGPPPLPKSHPGSGSNMVSPGLRKDSARSQQSLRDYAHQQHPQPPPMPQYRPDEFDSYRSGRSGRPSPPSSSASMNLSRQPTVYEMQPGNDSPPTSPRQGQPVTNEIIAQNKCKVFLQTNHQQWKSLGTSKLALYLQKPSGDKQLVVNAENKEKSILISTMVLSDGVERVGKTGVAIELSDQGVRTGIRYMLQVRGWGIHLT